MASVRAIWKPLEEIPDSEKCCPAMICFLEGMVGHECVVDTNSIQTMAGGCSACGAKRGPRNVMMATGSQGAGFITADWVELDEGVVADSQELKR